MNVFLTILLAVQMLAALGMIALILIQHGKGADMGAAFGSGSSGSLFGATGSANFLSRSTAVVATLFFVTSLGLTYFSAQKHQTPARATAQPVKPVAPVAPAPVLPNKAGEIPK